MAVTFLKAPPGAGVMANAPLLPRPTCMALPAALAQGVVASSGCIGNRVYTELGKTNCTPWFRGAIWRAWPDV